MMDAFESEFRAPEMVEGLYDLLNLSLEEACFARVASIFQSSGWGKSRAICELHRQGVWVFYCTFTGGTGYPRRSSVADWFLGRANALVSADTKGQLACMTFFLAYMEACLEELLLVAPSTNPRDFVRMLYKSGDQGCTEGAKGRAFWCSAQKRVDALLEAYHTEGLDSSSRAECWTDWESRAGRRVNGLVARLWDMLKDEQGTGVKVLFVFDEARILVKEDLGENLYLPLSRATSAFDTEAGILALFADTSSRVANFCAPIWLDKSDRMPATSHILATPIWACFWADYGLDDEEWSRLCSEYSISSEDVLSEFWPVRYGRPLWWGTFKAGLSTKTRSRAALGNVLRLARDKLLGGHGSWSKYVVKGAQLPTAAALAVLGSRCALHIDPHCSMVSDLVASHLMTVVKVNDTRECVWGTFPMEPTVAGSAAEIMQELDRQKRNREVYLPLSVALKSGWIHKGYKGELLTRLIILRAFDKAVRGKSRSWCTVDELVQALVGKSLLQLGREHGKKVEAAMELDSGLQDQESMLTEELKLVAKKRLCFQAFFKIGKKSCDVTVADLRMVAERRCALVGDEGTWGVDHFFPDVKGDVVIYEQVKAKQVDYGGLAAMAKESPAFCGLPVTGPYLDLHMNVENVGGGKVTLVDAKRVECAVREESGRSKVLTAVLESLAGDEGEAAATEAGRKRARWEKCQTKHPRLFKAWQDWLAVPRRNQVILKINGLQAFRPLLGDDLFDLLADTMNHVPLLDPLRMSEACQAASVKKMIHRDL